MSEKTDFSSLIGRLKESASSSSLPPVDQWQPDFCGDMDLVIKRNGDWLYQDSPIARQSLVKLFSRILKKENNDYFLVTPVEKLRILVEDAPFLVITMNRLETELGDVIEFTDNCDNKILLTESNPLWVELHPKTREPSPYITVRNNLNALLHRSVFYELVEMGQEKLIDDKRHLGVFSAGSFFSLGHF